MSFHREVGLDLCLWLKQDKMLILLIKMILNSSRLSFFACSNSLTCFGAKLNPFYKVPWRTLLWKYYLELKWFILCSWGYRIWPKNTPLSSQVQCISICLSKNKYVYDLKNAQKAFLSVLNGKTSGIKAFESFCVLFVTLYVYEWIIWIINSVY